MPKLKLALLSGGESPERDISLRTGEKIFETLDKDKFEIFKYDTKTDLKIFFNDAIRKKFDLVFPALHGAYGEDGRLQGMLDMIKMPYLFSGCLASALAMDKYKTKIIIKAAGIDTAEDELLEKYADYNQEEIIKKLSLPIVVKPVDAGSSVGTTIAKNKKELEQGIADAFNYSDRVLLEKYICGRELTVAVMGENNPQALPVIEIIPKISEWFDKKAKYEDGGSDEICPADIPDEIKNKVQAAALSAFETIGCRHLARADFIWSNNDDKLYFLEINTIPGMTAASLAPKAAKAAGMEFGEFLDRLIKGALTNV